MEKDLLDIEYEEKKIAEELEDIAISVEDGKVEFTNVDHSRRAGRFGRISDGNTTEYANIALEYFGNRCALSGEKFETFELEDSRYKTNLSAEHVVALAIGGHDIAPNIVPSVLQYNLRKNGYYILDYWPKQKDNNGKPIYSPYRLLKVVNYMLKSIEARKANAGDRESYRQAILTPNAIDNLLTKIEEQDLKETDNSKRQILSSTITTTTLDEDNKKILTIAPSIDRDIPDQHEQGERENDYREMIESFISDSIGVIIKELPYQKVTRENGTQTSLSQELQSMFERVVDTIPLEVKIRKTIIDTLEQQGIENVYTVTNSYIYNRDILEKVRKLSDKERQEYVTEQITTRVQELVTLLNKEEMATFVSSNPHALYDEGIVDRIALWQKLDIQSPDTHPRNIDFALKIVREYDFEGALGHTLTQEEEKAIVQSLIGQSRLNKGKGINYISTLQSKLIEAGLTEQEAYGAIINYAIGNGNGTYSKVLGGITKYSSDTVAEIKKDITVETIKEALLKNGMDVSENKEKLEELGIEADNIHPRNIDSALKIVREYDFEGALGHTLTQEEKKAIVQSLIGNSRLNKDMKTYIYSLQSKLVKAGLTEQEAYGAIINYAIGNGNYSNALGGKTKYSSDTIAEIKKDITVETIKEALLQNGMDVSENKEKLKELGIEADNVHPRNIDFALKIVREYDFEGALGYILTQEEEKAIVQSLIGKSRLNKGKGISYISTLQSKLVEAGLTEQEAYGAIINYAIGNGNYSDALVGRTKYSPDTVAEIKKDITVEDISKAVVRQQSVEIDEQKNKEKLKELGIEADNVHLRNIDSALKIVREYDFEGALGHTLTQEEEKAIVQSLIGQSSLNKDKRIYISTLQSKLIEAGLTEQEAYGAIINYAIGNGNYSNALVGRTKYSPNTVAETKKDITVEDISKAVVKQQKEVLQSVETDEQKNKEKLEELAIEADNVHPRNIDFALKIVREYDFEGALGHTLTQEEEKAIVQSLIGNSKLNKGKGINYISTLQSKLIEAGLTEQEAYGAIINYAIGNGNGTYSKVLGGITKYSSDTVAEIKKDITVETIKEALLKNGMDVPENKEKLEELGIEADNIHPRNIDSALKIVREYDFEGALGHTLTQEEKKAIVQSLIGNSRLNKDKRTSYISALQSKLIEAGLTEQEAYGAIINYAIGIGNGSYAYALVGKIKYSPDTVAEIRKDITVEDISKAVVKQQKKSIKLAKESVTKESVANIDETLEIIDEMVVENQKMYEGNIK